MRVFITGGTGFVGRKLAEFLVENGHTPVVIGRSASPGGFPDAVEIVVGDPTREGPWQTEVGRSDAVVNLAGASIFQRWTAKAKETIEQSRLQTTRRLVEAMAQADHPPQVFLSTSAVGYYGSTDDVELTEDGPPGAGFLADLTRAWESEATKAKAVGVRTVIMRFGVVLGPNGGALGQMIPLFRKYLGGRLGSGRQWFSWIHIHDLVRAALWLLTQSELAGAFKITAPNPVRNIGLTKALAAALKRPAFLPAPGFAMRLVLGEFASVLLEGQRVIPQKLLNNGFEFQFPNIETALGDLIDS
jgi:uncharacterized protein (TIGR01777 family)